MLAWSFAFAVGAWIFPGSAKVPMPFIGLVLGSWLFHTAINYIDGFHVFINFSS
jgi:hypothetical protein